MTRDDIATRVATVIGNALASIRSMVTTRGVSWEAAGAAAACAPMTHSDSFLPRRLRGRATRGRRKVECAVIEDWMMWKR